MSPGRAPCPPGIYLHTGTQKHILETIMDAKNPIAKTALSIYCLLFFALWTLMELLVFPMISDALGTWPDAVICNIIKLLIWTAPAAFLIRRYSLDLYISPVITFSRKGSLLCIIIAAAFFLYHLTVCYVMYGQISYVNLSAHSLLGPVLLVGITEETVFRGWLLNAFLAKMNPLTAVLINAVLFLLIHFPIWITKGLFQVNPAVFIVNCASIMLLSIIFSLSFMKSKSIVIPIILHMCWNLFNMIFIG